MRHLIIVMRRHDLSTKKTMTDTMTMTMKKTISKTYSGTGTAFAITCDVLIIFLKSLFEKGALWMPLGKLERALRTDFPVYGRPHTFSLPTIYKVLR